ncbi:MAG: hypothetical protein ACT4OX_06245 [Actinomycetota bacterium]
MTDTAAVRDLVRAVVRGEVDASELAVIGVKIAWTDAGCTIDEPAGLAVTKPSVEDIATGALVHWARSTGLRDWARVVLAATFLDLGAVEDHQHGDRVLEALWMAAAGDDLADDDLAILRSLVSGPAADLSGD